MADTSATLPGTGATEARSGSEGVSWSNPSNIEAEANYASITLAKEEYTDWLRASDFGFSIQEAGSTIDGIKVEINRAHSQSSSNISDSSLRLVDADGNNVGDDKASGSSWPTAFSFATAEYGSDSDDWNASLTATAINNSNFGVRLSAYNDNSIRSRTPLVAWIKVTVYYTINFGQYEESKTTILGLHTIKSIPFFGSLSSIFGIISHAWGQRITVLEKINTSIGIFTGRKYAGYGDSLLGSTSIREKILNTKRKISTALKGNANISKIKSLLESFSTSLGMITTVATYTINEFVETLSSLLGLSNKNNRVVQFLRSNITILSLKSSIKKLIVFIKSNISLLGASSAVNKLLIYNRYNNPFLAINSIINRKWFVFRLLKVTNGLKVIRDKIFFTIKLLSVNIGLISNRIRTISSNIYHDTIIGLQATSKQVSFWLKNISSSLELLSNITRKTIFNKVKASLFGIKNAFSTNLEYFREYSSSLGETSTINKFLTLFYDFVTDFGVSVSFIKQLFIEIIESSVLGMVSNRFTFRIIELFSSISLSSIFQRTFKNVEILVTNIGLKVNSIKKAIYKRIKIISIGVSSIFDKYKRIFRQFLTTIRLSLIFKRVFENVEELITNIGILSSKYINLAKQLTSKIRVISSILRKNIIYRLQQVSLGISNNFIRFIKSIRELINIIEITSIINKGIIKLTTIISSLGIIGYRSKIYGAIKVSETILGITSSINKVRQKFISVALNTITSINRILYTFKDFISNISLNSLFTHVHNIYNRITFVVELGLNPIIKRTIILSKSISSAISYNTIVIKKISKVLTNLIGILSHVYNFIGKILFISQGLSGDFSRRINIVKTNTIRIGLRNTLNRITEYFREFLSKLTLKINIKVSPLYKEILFVSLAFATSIQKNIQYIKYLISKEGIISNTSKRLLQFRNIISNIGFNIQLTSLETNAFFRELIVNIGESSSFLNLIHYFRKLFVTLGEYPSSIKRRVYKVLSITIELISLINRETVLYRKKIINIGIKTRRVFITQYNRINNIQIGLVNNINKFLAYIKSISPQIGVYSILRRRLQILRGKLFQIGIYSKILFEETNAFFEELTTQFSLVVISSHVVKYFRIKISLIKINSERILKGISKYFTTIFSEVSSTFRKVQIFYTFNTKIIFKQYISKIIQFTKIILVPVVIITNVIHYKIFIRIINTLITFSVSTEYFRKLYREFLTSISFVLSINSLKRFFKELATIVEEVLYTTRNIVFSRNINSVLSIIPTCYGFIKRIGYYILKFIRGKREIDFDRNYKTLTFIVNKIEEYK